MTRLLTLLFVACVAVAPADASEDPPATLDLFDEASWLLAREFCATPPPGRNQLWQINITIAVADSGDGLLRTTYAGRPQCGWYPVGADVPEVRWPETIDVTVPEGDTRPTVLIALDQAAGVYARATCVDHYRPEGYGRFHAFQFRLQATVGHDGVLRANRMSELVCDWYPLVTGSG